MHAQLPFLSRWKLLEYMLVSVNREDTVLATRKDLSLKTVTGTLLTNCGIINHAHGLGDALTATIYSTEPKIGFCTQTKHT